MRALVLIPPITQYALFGTPGCKGISGPRNGVYKRFARWSNNRLCRKVFAELAKAADFE